MKRTRLGLLPALAVLLAACGGSGSDDRPVACVETGEHACKTGQTEPLYTFQWALNYAESYFKSFPETFDQGLDLNVEPVHKQGFKGQGVNVLVLDTGTDLHNEDLAPNADFSMSWNVLTEQNDPYPDLAPSDAPHGTAVAGIIAAAQNGKGVMGIAPRATLGASNYLSGEGSSFEAYGGAPWSSKAHIFNASYSADMYAEPYESDVDSETLALRGMKKLRDGKGAIFIRSASNSFEEMLCGLWIAHYFDCTNPANDRATLESNVIVVAALNAKGSASSYSSAGPVVWITGMGGEHAFYGNYGEGTENGLGNAGPTIFSTDISGCVAGYSRAGARTPFLRGETRRNGELDNPNCDYGYMNGTSAAAPTISGVVALMLSANPELTWRDVRDILRASARKVDPDYLHNIPVHGDKPYGALQDLTTNEAIRTLGSPADIRDGSRFFPMNLGWQKNAAGHEYSDWYGFGVPDAEKAVALALEYKKNPGVSRSGDVLMPEFRPVFYWQLNELDKDLDNVQLRFGTFPYQRVTSMGTFTWGAQTVDQLQLRLTGENVCLGSLGIAAKSPSGTVSLLKLPNDHFKADGDANFTLYGLGSFAFYGEPAQGDWEVFAIAANPDKQITVGEIVDGKLQERQSAPCPSKNPDGSDRDFKLLVEARIIAQ